MEKKESVTKLIEDGVKDSRSEVSEEIVSKVTDMIQEDRKYAKEAVTAFTKIFKSEKYKKSYLALLMIEQVSKQGTLQFHEYLSQDGFMKEFMKCFKILRGKGGIFSRWESKSKKELRVKLQEQALYMLQLWADTFMMYQETYPGFQKCYRELKVEGIEFPERHKMEETIMNNLEGINSPMYDFIIQAEKNRNEEPPTKKSITSSGRKSNPERKNNPNRKSNVSRKSKSIGGRYSDLGKVKEAPLEGEDKIDMDPDLEISEINMKLQDLEDNHGYVEDELKYSEEIEAANYKKYTQEEFDKAVFEISKSHFDRLDDMLNNCESYTDIMTEVIIEMYEEALKGKLKCEKIMQIRKSQNLEGPDDKDARESLIHMNLKINDFKEKYYLLKERQVREYNKAKRRIEKKKRKIEKDNKKAERRRKRREEKLAKRREQLNSANPFSVNDKDGMANQPLDATVLSESDTESSHSDSSESEKSELGSDEDGLHAPKSMHELRLQEAERKRIRNNKKRDKEIKKILKDKEKKRKSKIEGNAGSNGGGFLRNSVLVQKTLNFFGRGSKPKETLLKHTDCDDEDIEAKKLDSNDDNQDLFEPSDNLEKRPEEQPKLNDFFVQTSSKPSKEIDGEEQACNNEEDKNEEATSEEEKYEEEKRNSDNDASPNALNGDEDKKDIFEYQGKPPTGLPPLSKKFKSTKDKGAKGVKKLMAPPKALGNRHSVLQQPNLLNLLDN
ncbi:unnamed protein product [Moneuplotes crassus]|uniref:VHS domain-containing protein n=1 Tax=Euplotes crassus TaxID=5936 RepID=A0AAD1X4Z2_EUPCR|nr:unnamed protein product [Moneuplotes crassus]